GREALVGGAVRLDHAKDDAAGFPAVLYGDGLGSGDVLVALDHDALYLPLLLCLLCCRSKRVREALRVFLAPVGEVCLVPQVSGDRQVVDAHARSSKIRRTVSLNFCPAASLSPARSTVRPFRAS